MNHHPRSQEQQETTHCVRLDVAKTRKPGRRLTLPDRLSCDRHLRRPTESIHHNLQRERRKLTHIPKQGVSFSDANSLCQIAFLCALPEAPSTGKLREPSWFAHTRGNGAPSRLYRYNRGLAPEAAVPAQDNVWHCCCADTYGRLESSTRERRAPWNIVT